ncbi:zinc knuckle CX2CX4HX4C containing protein [Tanacetum coccineum]
MKSMREYTVGEDSIRGIANSFSKVIDEINESATNHAAMVERNHVWNGAAPMPCGPGMVNVAEIFGMTSEKRKAVMDAIFAMWDAFVDANPSGTCASSLVNSSSLRSMAKDTPNLVDTMHIDESPIFLSVSIQEKPSSYVGAAGGSKPEPRLEDVLENGPWMIHNSPIILKKWSMDTYLCKEELTRIPVWVKIHDVHIQVFLEDRLRSIASQIGVLLIKGSGFTIETINIKYEWKPPRCDLCKIFGHVYDNCPNKVSIHPIVDTPIIEKPMMDSKRWEKKKGKSKSTNGGQFGGHSFKQDVRYEPKATAGVPKKGATKKNLPLKAIVPPTKECNISMSNSYAALDDEIEEELAKEELSRKCDYKLESLNKKNSELLSNVDGFYVPSVVDELASKKVLTSELIHAHHDSGVMVNMGFCCADESGHKEKEGRRW